MCGKFTQMYSRQDVHAFSKPLGDMRNDDDVVISTPMRMAKIMRARPIGSRRVILLRKRHAPPRR